ncbi:MAG: glycosyltransferase family 2 protein [candidate division NC10 bacterium]|nr:glycosyltransferase family 2 protein [candidate division NC10 bacterium]MDE2321745.1 glycosyltransferase family 2 protein [candidate division NC10 bacterium]
MRTPWLSIVIPFCNEEENVWPLHGEIVEALGGLGQPYEVVAVDDGSTDRTLATLEAIVKDDPRWRVVVLRRNFGQTAALSAGFDHAKGDVIVTLDGDLQNDPADIPRLLELIQDYDVVSGWRAERKDPFLSRRIPSMLANWLISVTTGVKLHDYGCTLKAYRRVVVDNLRLYGELHRFIPAIASWMGVAIAEVKTNHRPRRFGRSKYSILRTVRVLLDLIAVKFLLRFSTSPIQIFGGLGLTVGVCGGGLLLYLAGLKLLAGQPIGGRPLLLLAVLLLILGVQLVGMGLLGEMVARVYHETQRKPIYMVQRTIHGVKTGGDLSELRQ